MSDAQRMTHPTHITATTCDYVVPVPSDQRGRAFGVLISEARRRKGMRQEDLAVASGVSRRTLTRWEGGDAERPDPEQVRAVCLILGVDPRRAAVALGYLTEADIDPPEQPTLDPQVAEAVALLEDPRIPAAEKESIVGYLRYLANRPADSRDRAG